MFNQGLVSMEPSFAGQIQDRFTSGRLTLGWASIPACCLMPSFRDTAAQCALLPTILSTIFYSGKCCRNYLIFALLMSFHPANLRSSGGADRRINVLAPWHPDCKDSCVQTLCGHGGTVICIHLACGSLFSCSTDGYVFVWGKQEGRDMLMFPWYAIHHRINFAEKASAVTDTAWINSIRYNEQMRGGELYCCDASGKIWTVAAHLQPDGKMKMGKEPKAWPKAHNLGARTPLTHCVLRHCLTVLAGIVGSECVAVEGALYTVSNDLTFRQHDVASGACRRTLSATGKAKFSAVLLQSNQFHEYD
jgi:WD40 repeat protein